MIAYKPYMLCPPEQRPLGIPLGAPWIEQSCEESEVATLRRAGWTVMTDEEYAEYLDIVSADLSTWEANKLNLKVEASIQEASEFAMKLMVCFAAENVLLGITQEGKTAEVLQKTAGVLPALQAGSLYLAIDKIREIPETDYDEKYITAARLLTFINKIETYLQLPLSETL